MSTPQELYVESLTEEEIGAIKAQYAGEADAYQQRLLLRVVINKFSRAQDLLYIPGDTHATAFINGRAFVGATLLKHLKLPVGALIPSDDGDKNAEARTRSR